MTGKFIYKNSDIFVMGTDETGRIRTPAVGSANYTGMYVYVKSADNALESRIVIRHPDSIRESGRIYLQARDTSNNSTTLALWPTGELYLGSSLIYPVTYMRNTTDNWGIKYSNGFILQGGRVGRGSSLGANSTWTSTVTFPIVHSATAYSLLITDDNNDGNSSGNGEEIGVGYKKTTGFTFSFYCRNEESSTNANIGVSWLTAGF